MEFTRSGLRRNFRNTSWLISGRIFQTAVGLVVTIGMARVLGPDQFGLLNFVLAATYLVGVVANFGLEGYVRKELIEQSHDPGAILGTFLRLKLCIAVFLYAIMAVTALVLHANGWTLLLFLILGGTFVASSFMGFELWFDARAQSRFNAIPLMAATFTGGTIKLLMVYLAVDVVWFASAMLFETALLVLLRFLTFRIRPDCPGGWSWDPALAKRFVRKCWPLLLTALAANIYLKFDQVMLGIMVDSAAVGIYGAAVRLSTVWYFIPTALATSLFPAIIKSRMESADKYRCRVNQYFGLNAVIAYAIMLPMAGGGPFLVNWIYGTAYAQAGPILVIHILSLILVFLQAARQQYLLAEGRHHFILVSVTTGAVLNIILNLILIPPYAGMGAAAATVVAQVGSVLLINFLHKPQRHLGMIVLRGICAPWTLLTVGKPAA